MPEFKLSRLRYNWKGQWTAGVEYFKDDIVNSGGKVYVAIAQHIADSDFYNDLNFLNNEIPPSLAPRWVLMIDAVSWQGPWTENTYYNLGDLVKVGAVVYLCIEPHTSVEIEENFVDDYSDNYWVIYSLTQKWKNQWMPSKVYSIGDVVVYSGNVYKCVQFHTSASTYASGIISDLAKWQLLFFNNIWKGNWSTSTVYYQRDIVKYGGTVYRCLEQHVSTGFISQGLEYDQSKWFVEFEGIEFAGEWSQGEFYHIGDVVKYGSYLYKCINPHSINSGEFFNSMFWQVYCPGEEFDVSWNNSSLYQPGDIVNYGGYLFVSNTSNINSQPSPDSNGSVNDWSILFVNTRIMGEWYSQGSYQVGDIVRRQGQLYVAKRDSQSEDVDVADDGSTINNEFWELVIPGSKWKGQWAPFITYVTGDLILYKSGSYRCVGKHRSIYGNRPGDEAGLYWEKYTYASDRNVLEFAGDIKTYGLTVDGSTIGVKSLPAGPEGSVIQSVNSSVSYTQFNASTKVYYVSTLGTDKVGIGTSMNSPWRTIRYALENITGPATVFVKAGTYEEILPLHVPAFVAIVGDELRSTIIKPQINRYSTADFSAMIDTFDYLQANLRYIILGQQIGTENLASPAYGTDLYGIIPQNLTAPYGTSSEVTETLTFLQQMRARLVTNTQTTINATNNITSTVSRLQAATIIENNITFLINETRGFLRALKPTYSIHQYFDGDVLRILKALAYDLRYPGNYLSARTGEYLYHAKTGSVNKIQNMFLMQDGTGLRNCTLVGLDGTLGTRQPSLTKRPTAGAYTSLDPGWGPNDNTVWVGTKSPYIQNVTTFGTGCVGLKIDGDLHAGGNQTIVSNDFTQVLSDGIGIWCNGTGRTEAVSVFTYYNHIGYLSTNGGRIRGTNGNCSYGSYGASAEGFSLDETPITATVNNRYYDATVDSALTSTTGAIQKFFFSHTGQNYTSAIFNISGAGQSAQAVGDEIRNGAISEVRIIDAGDSTNAGGGGYVIARNNAQSGNNISITIAGSDQEVASSYRDMRLFILTGTGAAQYGYIAEYDDVGKIAYIASETFNRITSASTINAAGGNLINVTSNATLRVNDPIIFRGTTFGNIQNNTVYYVRTLVGNNQITISGSPGPGSVFGLINGSGTMYIHKLGWDHLVSGTTIESLLDTTSYYSIEPRVTFTSPGFTRSAVTMPLSRQWQSIAYGNGTWVAVCKGSSTVGYSSNGTTWSYVTTPHNYQWEKVAYGADGYFIAVASNGQIMRSSNATTWTTPTVPQRAYSSVAYGAGTWVAVSTGTNVALISTNSGQTWTSVNLPEGADWIDVTYGAGKFVAVAQSDSTTTATVYSTDAGATWNLGSFAGSCKAVAFGNNRFVAIAGGYPLADDVFWSFDGITWNVSSIDGQNWQDLTYSQGLFAAVADGSNIFATSLDGITWNYNTLQAVSTWRGVAGGAVGKFICVSGSTDNTVGSIVTTGPTAQGRVVIKSGRVDSILIWEPGSGYTSPPAMVLSDPNNTSDVLVSVRLADGVLGNPTFINRGIGYVNISTTAVLSGDGFKDQYQLGRYLVVSNLTRLPSPGDNLNISGIDDYTYKVLNSRVLSGSLGNYTAQITIAKILKIPESPDHDTNITIRQQYSQVRLTGHDFLDIGLGNFLQTNYPDTLFPIGTVLEPDKEVYEYSGGRCFYSSTDQDGNFRVGELFAVEQSTGTVTISADFFELQGLEELSIGGVSVGGSGVVIREFSTDPLFIADSNNIIPTQRAIKAYLGRRVSGGGSDAFTVQVTAGIVKVGPTLITTTTGEAINIPVKVNFNQPFEGDLLVQTFFLAGHEGFYG